MTTTGKPTMSRTVMLRHPAAPVRKTLRHGISDGPDTPVRPETPGPDVLDTDEEVLHVDLTVAPVPVRVAERLAPGPFGQVPVASQPGLRKKDLLDLACARSGIKRRLAKPVIEAALAVLGEALAQGRELHLLPLGKVKVSCIKTEGNGQIITAHVRHSHLRQPENGEISARDPLAQAAE